MTRTSEITTQAILFFSLAHGNVTYNLKRHPKCKNKAQFVTNFISTTLSIVFFSNVEML